MKLMRIFRQCVYSSKPIREICRRDTIDDYMKSIVMKYVDDSMDMEDFMTTNNIEDEDEFYKAYEQKSDKIWADFLKYRMMDCGDYYIAVYEDDEDVNRPN